MACTGFRWKAGRIHCSSLRKALQCAATQNMSVSLHVVVTCSASLEHLLQRIYPVYGAVRTLELSDGCVGRVYPLKDHTHGTSCLSARALRSLSTFQGLQRLSLQGFSFAYTSPSNARDLVHVMKHLSGPTDLTISRSVRGYVLQSMLVEAPQLRSLDACCIVNDSEELLSL